MTVVEDVTAGWPSQGTTPPRAARLLLVEDEPNIIGLLQSWFELSGWEVSTADDGLNAIGLVEAVAPEVLVLDMMLPGADGLEVMRQVRALDPTIPIVIHSARDSHEDRERALRAGAAAYVTKPCSLQHLEDEVCRALGRRQAEVGQTASPGTCSATTSSHTPIPDAAHGTLTAGARQPVAR